MKIMFICTGNICRSAMAHGMMEKLIKENNIDAEIYSCGVYADTGDFATYNAIEAANEYGADISNHRATNIRESKIEEMDLILCATMSYKQSVSYLYPSLKTKVFTMKEYARLDNNGQDMDIKDPWGYDEFIYRKCAKEINDCLEKTIEILKNK